MKESILDVLLYLFEHYFTNDAISVDGDDLTAQNGPLMGAVAGLEEGHHLGEVHEDLDQGGLLPLLLGEEGPFRGELQHQKLGEEGEELAFRPEVPGHLGQGLLHHGEDGHLLWGKPAPPQGLPQGLRGPLKAGKGDADHRRTGRFLGRRRPTFSRTSSMVAWATALARLAPSKRASIT